MHRETHRQDILFVQPQPSPQYSTVDDKLKFELSPGLFYNNVIETAASAMEMSVIGARNIVNLINQRNVKDEL